MLLERYRSADWRAVLVALNRTFKTNKAFESAKLNGLLVVALDANEQFKSQHRCCRACCQRQLELKDVAGQSRELDDVDATVIWRIGHQRWGIENHAFNELTQHYHLSHCPRHQAGAIQTWRLILVLGFKLFELFVRLHGKLWRQGRTPLQKIARQLDRALEAVAELHPRIYSGDHQGHYPFSTNGFGDALLFLVKADDCSIANICGPGDDGHNFKGALKNNSIVREEQCSRVYIQGLSESNDPQLCILFDRNSCRGGNHFRSPWGHRVRELCLLGGEMQIIRDEDWPDFSRKQFELLVTAGFSRTNALHFYPAAGP